MSASLELASVYRNTLERYNYTYKSRFAVQQKKKSSPKEKIFSRCFVMSTVTHKNNTCNCRRVHNTSSVTPVSLHQIAVDPRTRGGWPPPLQPWRSCRIARAAHYCSPPRHSAPHPPLPRSPPLTPGI